MGSIKNLVFILLWLGAIGAGLFLGFWQLDRLTWKKDLLAAMDAAYAVPYPQRLSLNDTVYPFDKNKFLRRVVVGHVDASAPVFYVSPRQYKGQVGAHVYIPMMVQIGKDLYHFYVLFGFVQNNMQITSLPIENIKFNILIRAQNPSGMVRAENTDRAPALAFNAEEWSKRTGHMQNPVLVREGDVLSAADGHAIETNVIPVGDRPVLPNDHLLYAWFWFGMTGILLACGIMAAIRRLFFRHLT
jgi:cytochrome oxidase assembly protein ShyY1